MTDRFGRTIDYMRVSITDRCNLRCKYCMPKGIALMRHRDILRFEEMLRLCSIAARLGITKFKITGGEPLVRLGSADFIARLKSVPGVEQVTLTTNGVLLKEHLDELLAAKIDGINISADTLDADVFRALTGCGEKTNLERIISECARRGVKTKVNAVLLQETFGGVAELAGLARYLPVDVRFIELMPVGEAVGMKGVGMKAALERLREYWPDLRPVDEKRGNGPASYYASKSLLGRIGFISAMSHSFCDNCNRVRLSSAGILKPCLCYEEGKDLRTSLRAGASDGELLTRMRACIESKPQAHCFGSAENVTERNAMSAIGG